MGVIATHLRLIDIWQTLVGQSTLAFVLDFLPFSLQVPLSLILEHLLDPNSLIINDLYDFDCRSSVCFPELNLSLLDELFREFCLIAF
jgi:hypothetical protein